MNKKIKKVKKESDEIERLRQPKVTVTLNSTEAILAGFTERQIAKARKSDNHLIFENGYSRVYLSVWALTSTYPINSN